MDTQKVHGEVVKLVSEKIGRPIDETETDALAFVVSRKWKKDVGVSDFVENVLGVNQEHSSREAALAIHNSVFAINIQETGNLATQKPSESERLEALKNLLSKQHKNALESFQKGESIRLGAVPKDWLPK